MRKSVWMAVMVSCVAISAAHAQYGPFVFGFAYAEGASHTDLAANFFVKWCKADADLRPNLNMCSSGRLNNDGYYNIDVSVWGDGYYYPYLWDPYNFWSSSNYPVTHAIFLAYSQFGNNIASMYSTPQALPPSPANPSEGAVNVGTSFTLQWTDGLDSNRRSPSWPVTYDIYASGNESPEILEYSNIPCNGVGICSVAVSGLSYTTRWQWRVVARMHSAPVISQAGSDSSYETGSGTFHFSTTWDPSIPLHLIQTYSGNYLRAPGGGGGSFDAGGTGNGYETQFQIVDTNGGTLYSGDTVNIRTNRNFYASANYGGGYGVDAIQKWANGYETWTIIRIAGFGPINAGDQVAFVSVNGYYMTAELGGGGTVNANRTAIGPWETFTLN